MRRLLIVSVAVALGCGGASEQNTPVRAASAPADARPKAPAAPRRVDSLARSEVLAAVDAGLGHFLQRVEVEPALQDGHFKGFRVVELFPADYWQGVDLVPGDVVTQVNGMPIERETQAYAAFEALRSAKELRVSIVRDGQPRELVLPIVDDTVGGGGGEPSNAAAGASG